MAQNEQKIIGVDFRSMWFPDVAQRGIGQYAVNHLTALAELMPHWRFILLKESNTPDRHLRGLTAHHNIIQGFYDDIYDYQLDLLHIPDPMSILPFYDSPFRIAPRGIPLTILFHDLIPLVFRQYHLDTWSPATKISYFNRLTQLNKSQCHILTNSSATLRDLKDKMGIEKERMTAIMAGINTVETDGSSNPKVPFSSVQDEFGLGNNPFCLMVGGMDYHKDPQTSLDGFLAARQEVPGLKLVIAGSLGDPIKLEIKESAERNNIDDVVFTDFISREKLNTLYSQAAALLFPSLYEGFGFPVLEAMAKNCPVITTEVSSLPEVAGNAALYISPSNAAEMAQAIVRLVKEPDLREELRKRGKKRVALFSWKSTAEKTVGAWKKVLPGKSIEMQRSSASATTLRKEETTIPFTRSNSVNT